MACVAEFLKSSWEEGGSLPAIEAEADESGRLIPKVRVVNPGWNTRKCGGYSYLLLYGIIETREVKVKNRDCQKTFASFPLGVGASKSDPEELLQACLTLDITVRRTAGSNEKIVYGCNGFPMLLDPWREVLSNGVIFPAIKVCNNADLINLETPHRFRPVFLTITNLTDSGVYRIPRTLQEFRMTGAIAFNLLVQIKVGADFSGCGVRGNVNDNGERVTSFMVHVGHFVRRYGKEYSPEYCRQKVERMQMIFSLGAVGGLSLHIFFKGVLSKALKAQLGYRSVVCYSLMDINPALNKVMWKAECEIDKVTAVFQPSVPKEFKIYEDVLIDNTGKILK
ncbi:MAG: matrix protein [Ochotona cansus jeilongvirus]|uniref:Matrix protein n=2 Tax=Jeilongvirus TaxID=2560155 RepID=A0AAT9TSQ5_9MONO|nr:MAG: matrix protein [Eozapus setchuanus jeilongvirus]WEU70820.1 MAG: matrix protein [Ochotona cansus jeilongvirus]